MDSVGLTVIVVEYNGLKRIRMIDGVCKFSGAALLHSSLFGKGLTRRMVFFLRHAGGQRLVEWRLDFYKP